MPNATPEMLASCMTRCNDAQNSATPGGTTGPAGTAGTPGSTTGSPTNTWVDPSTGKTQNAKEMCISWAAGDANKMRTCDCMGSTDPNCGKTPSSASTGTTPSSTMGGAYDPKPCSDNCSLMTGSEPEKQLCRDACVKAASGEQGMMAPGYDPQAQCLVKCNAAGGPMTDEQRNTCRADCGKISSGNYAGPGSMGSGMKECFYTNATINGTAPGYTVWCRTDYNDCHKGSPSGESISTAGLSLGAPSQCASGWSNAGDGMRGSPGSGSKWTCTGRNSAGQTNTIRCDSPNVGCGMSDKDVNQTVGGNPTCTQDGSGQTNNNNQGNMGGDPVKNCENNCDSMTREQQTNPACTKANPEPWCRQSVGDCKAQCKNMNGGGNWNGGGQDDMVNCCTRVQCYGNQCPTVMPSCSQRLRSQCNREGGEIRDGGNYSGPGGPPGGQWSDLSGAKMQFLNAIQNYRRQVEEMQFRARENNVNAGSEISSFISAVDAMEARVKAATTMEPLNGYNQFDAIDQLGKTVWNKIQTGGMARQFDEVSRRVEEAKRALTDMANRGADISSLRAPYDALVAAVTNAKQNQTQDSMQAVYSEESALWRAMESVGSMNRGGKMDNNQGGQYADRCQMILDQAGRMQEKGGNEAVYAKFRGMYEDCTRQARGAITGKGINQGEFDKNQEEFRQVYAEEVHGQNSCDMVDRIMNEARGGINEGQTMVASLRNAASKKKLEALIVKAKGLLGRAYDYRQQNDCEKAFVPLREMGGIGNEADAILSQAGGGVSFVNYDDDIQNQAKKISRQGGTNANSVAQTIKDLNWDKGEIFVVLDEIDIDVLSNYLEARKGGAKGTDVIGAASQAGLSALDIQELLQKKEELDEQIAERRATLTKLDAKVQAMIAGLNTRNFSAEAADAVLALVENAEDFTATEMEAEIREIEKQSNIDITGYSDVNALNDHAWAGEAIANAKGWMKGNPDGTFGINETVRLADAGLVLARREAVDNTGASPESSFATGAPAYAKEALAGLEANGADFSGFENKSADRLDIAHLIVAVYGDELASGDGSAVAECADASKLPEADRDAVDVMLENGIMTCFDNGNFRPGNDFTRPQFAKLLLNLENATGQTSDVIAEDDAGSAAAGTAKTTTEASTPTEGHPGAEAAPPEAPAPVVYTFNSHEVSEKDLTMIRMLVSEYIRLNGKLSTDKAVSMRVSLMNSLDKDLGKTQNEVFGQLRYDNFGEDYIAKVKKDMNLRLPPQEMVLLLEIMEASGQPMSM